MLDIYKIMWLIRETRQIFHSEDDFKFAFAIAVKQLFPIAEIRLEAPIYIKMINWNNDSIENRVSFDLIIKINGSEIPIELKYKTKALEFTIEEEVYKLTTHGATDVGRYSFRKDIYRVEQFLNERTQSKNGFVVILTNDSKYFTENASTKSNVDKNYSVHDGAKIPTEDLGWYLNKMNLNEFDQISSDKKKVLEQSPKLHWTKKKELAYKLNLEREYEIRWNSFSNFKNSEFKFCVIESTKSR